MTISVIKKQRAFTFIEIFLVIIFLGVLLGMALPRVKNSFESMQQSNFSSDLQDFMRYLKDRAILEGKVIILNIEQENRDYWANIKDSQIRIKTYAIPKQIKVSIEKDIFTGVDSGKISFYPDGQIDKVTIVISSQGQKDIILTTKGIFSGVKAITKE